MSERRKVPLSDAVDASVGEDNVRVLQRDQFGRYSSGVLLTWPEIRRLAAIDPESPMPRVRAIWERITAHPEWHSDANGETMLVVSDDAMAEMDAALDPGTEGGGE